MKIIKKEVEIITNKKSIGFIDNGDYSIKTTWKLFGIKIKEKKLDFYGKHF